MKYRIVGMVVALMLALLPLSAFAQTGSTGVDNSGFQVVNLGSAAANVVVTYYNKDGSTNATQNVTIQPNASFTFFGETMKATAGFNGSVVVSSDQPIAAIGNLVNNAGTLAGSYGGFNGGSQNVSVPLVERGNFGIDTWFNVQNAGSTAATVTITYIPGVAGNTGVTDSATIAPGAAASFFQKDKTALGDRFVGSATITSNQPIVATVNQESTNLLTYDAFTNGSTTIAAPLIASNNFGNYTGIQIQNVGTAAADVTLTYSANSVGAGGGASACPTPTPSTFNLAAGASKTVIQSGGGSAAEGFDLQFASCRYVGSATASSAQPLVGIVNQVNTGSVAGSAYETFNPTTTTATTVAPLIQANNFGIFSGVQVQNTGSASASVTVTYGANTADASAPGAASNCPTPTARTQTIAAGASFTFLQSNVGDASNGFDSQFNGCRYIGSATITASGSTIAAIVNQVLSGGGDTLLTYDTFSQ